MKKLLIIVFVFLGIACVVLGIRWLFGPRALKLDTAYQAVLLDNAQVYYAKIERMDSEFTVLTDVYYVQNQVDPQTKQVKNILIRRGTEWHAPNRSAINTRHILMIEPVTSGSQVADLIEQLKRKDR